MITEISKKLLYELFKLVSIKKININQSSEIWLRNLFNKIKCIKKIYSSKGVDIECSRLNQEKFYNNKFVADIIQDDIKNINSCHVYKILNTTVVIGSDNLKDINLDRIANIINIMRSLSGSANHILINIWNTDHTKYLPHKCTKLNPININSGSTLPGEFINLWRQEELYKVLIHELVHTFFLDFRDDINIEQYIRDTFGISNDSPVYIWESYTEFLAVIIHAIYISKDIETVIKILSVETHFNYLQCAKILNHFGCKSNNNLINKKCTLKYETDILSYFYIKTALLHSLDESIAFMNKFNINLVKFNQDCLQSYLTLLKDTTNKKCFIKQINKNIKLLPKIKNNTLLNTLRMTIIEVK